MIKYLKKTGLPLVISILIFIVLTILIQVQVVNAYYARILMNICINIIVAVSANMIINYTGQLTLGHAGFMAIGAYAAAEASITLKLPFVVALIFGGIVAGFFGFLIGMPTLRLKGDYLAITTLGFNQIIVVAIQNITPLGGAQGLTGIPPKTTFVWVFFSMVVCLLIMYNIIHSNHGRAMVSVREDEIAAEAMGINTTRTKILAFTVAAFFAGFAGGLYAHYMMYIEPTSFNFLTSINYIIYVVVGGTGNFLGCIISTSVLTLLPEFLRFIGDLRLVIYPLLLIVIMIMREKNFTLSRLLKLFTGKKAIAGGKQ